MTGRKDQVHPSIYLLADHLDAALALAEDLRATRERLPGSLRRLATTADIGARHRATRTFVETVRTLEVLLVSRVMAARGRAEDLRRELPVLQPLASLFAGGTVALVDAVAEFGDASEIEFDTGDNALTFLQQRALLAPPASLDRQEQLTVSDDYLVARRIHLGSLMDLLAAFLDTLDRQFDLYVEREPATGGEAQPGNLRAALAEMQPTT